MADRVKFAGRYRGRREEFYVDTSVPLPIRFSVAGLADFRRAIEKASESMLTMQRQINETVFRAHMIEQERRAYAAFCKDGGNPGLIREIEEMYGVDTKAIGEAA